MRDYEIVYIFKSGFTPEEIEGKLDRYHAILTGVEGGEITAVEQWGKRQLAYPIRKEPNGYYVVAQFKTEAEALPELERVLKLDEELLRHLIVIAEGELPAPPSMDTGDRGNVRPSGRPRETAKSADAKPAEDAEPAEPTAEDAEAAEPTAEEADGDEAEESPEASDAEKEGD